MKFRIDENLQYLHRYYYGRIEPFSEKLAQFFGACGLIEENDKNHLVPFIQAAGPQYVLDIAQAFCEFFHRERMTSDDLETLCKLVVLRDDTCPYCGSEVDEYDREGHDNEDGDYWTPSTWTVDFYIYRCRECGEKFKSKVEL